MGSDKENDNEWWDCWNNSSDLHLKSWNQLCRFKWSLRIVEETIYKNKGSFHPRFNSVKEKIVEFPSLFRRWFFAASCGQIKKRIKIPKHGFLVEHTHLLDTWGIYWKEWRIWDIFGVLWTRFFKLRPATRVSSSLSSLFVCICLFKLE